MSRDLIVRFRNEETLENLERTADALGIPMDELAEAALEIAVLGAGSGGKLQGISERLRTYGTRDLARDIQEFARSEVAFSDPLQSHLVNTDVADKQDPYQIGSLFARRLGRG